MALIIEQVKSVFTSNKFIVLRPEENAWQCCVTKFLPFITRKPNEENFSNIQEKLRLGYVSNIFQTRFNVINMKPDFFSMTSRENREYSENGNPMSYTNEITGCEVGCSKTVWRRISFVAEVEVCSIMETYDCIYPRLFRGQ